MMSVDVATGPHQGLGLLEDCPLNPLGQVVSENHIRVCTGTGDVRHVVGLVGAVLRGTLRVPVAVNLKASSWQPHGLVLQKGCIGEDLYCSSAQIFQPSVMVAADDHLLW